MHLAAGVCGEHGEKPEINSGCGPQVSCCCTVRCGCLGAYMPVKPAHVLPACLCPLQAYTQHKVDEVLLLSNQLALLKQQLEAHQQEAAVQEARKDYSLQVRAAVVGQGVLWWGTAVFGRCCGATVV